MQLAVTLPRPRRKLELELPPAFLNYLSEQKFSTISQFRKQFHVTNPSRARAILQQMLDNGLIVTSPDPRPGRKGMVFTLSKTEVAELPTTRRGRGKSQRYYDLQKQVLEYLGKHPEGRRFGSIPDDLDIKPNDATFIKGLKELVTQGKVVRTELAGQGKAVLYSLAKARKAVPSPTPAPTADEGNIIETLLANYEDALNKIEQLQARLDTLEKREPEKPKALPGNLQERLRKLQARDKELATQR